jgi:hypothetical protein
VDGSISNPTSDALSANFTMLPQKAEKFVPKVLLNRWEQWIGSQFASFIEKAMPIQPKARECGTLATAGHDPTESMEVLSSHVFFYGAVSCYRRWRQQCNCAIDPD